MTEIVVRAGRSVVNVHSTPFRRTTSKGRSSPR